MTTIITVRELHQQFPKIKKGLSKGHHYTVVSHGKPVAKLEPPLPEETRYTGKDFLKALEKAVFKGGDPLLSQKIDTYLYGAPYDPTRY